MLYSIIDVGSNSIRMTIFRHGNDTLDMLMNKKSMAGLAGYVEKGALNEAGIKKCCEEIRSFVKLAQNLSSSNILNFIELSDDFGIVELATPKPWVGKSLSTLDVRAKYRVNIIAIRKGGDEHDLEVAPGADYVLAAGDVVVTLGRNEYIDRLHDL